jgi:hypothetical protein
MLALLKFLTAPRRNLARANLRFCVSILRSQISSRRSRLFSPGNVIFSPRITTHPRPPEAAITAFRFATRQQTGIPVTCRKQTIGPFPVRNTFRSFRSLPANLRTRKIPREWRRDA